MKTCYAVTFLWISMVLFSNFVLCAAPLTVDHKLMNRSCFVSTSTKRHVAVARNIVNNISDDTLYQSSRIINQRLERISERLSGKLENRFQISYRGVLPSEYRIWDYKPFLGMDTKIQTEYDMDNYYYAAASKATVFGSLTNAKGLWYDDKGKPITEEEIRAYMISDYKPGCCLLGCVIGSGASFLPGCAAGIYIAEGLGTDFDEDLMVAT